MRFNLILTVTLLITVVFLTVPVQAQNKLCGKWQSVALADWKEEAGAKSDYSVELFSKVTLLVLCPGQYIMAWESGAELGSINIGDGEFTLTSESRKKNDQIWKYGFFEDGMLWLKQTDDYGRVTYFILEKDD